MLDKTSDSITHNEITLSTDCVCDSQYYAQNNDSLFWLSSFPFGDSVRRFDLRSATEDGSFNVAVGAALGGHACLASAGR